MWQRGPVYWDLLVTDEAGNTAWAETTNAPRERLHPQDGYLVTVGLCPFGDRKPGGNGSSSCPVIATSDEREDALVTGLLARGRSDPGTRVRLRPVRKTVKRKDAAKGACLAGRRRGRWPAVAPRRDVRRACPGRAERLHIPPWPGKGSQNVLHKSGDCV